MNCEQQEMAVWREAYMLAISQGASYGDADSAATTAAESFRRRYPPQPMPPPAVWYDEPPFPKDGQSYPCWVAGEDDACAVHWSEYAMSPLWVYLMTGEARPVPLNGRRVSPIAKPPEPPQ